MQGYSDGRKRLRIGKYRIIYNYGQNGEIEVLYIMDIDTRGDIYKQEGSVCMSAATKEAINLMEILPESDQNFALEFIKKLVLAWDPDYTKVTSAERKALEEAEKDIAENGTISHDNINWDQGAIKIFANVIRKILKDSEDEGKKVTQVELANALGISKQGFTNKMTRDSFFIDDVVKIANYLGMQVILKGENEYVIEKED